jgi:kinesin family protein 15
VVIRVRPHSNEELSVNDFLTYSDREIRLGRNSFAFDRIFSVDSQQQDIFNQVGIKLVHHSLEGYNSCVFAYGQTGSGKTHTMVGSGDGIIQRSIEQLFLRVNAAAASNDYSITCSYFEIYNEQLVDLLDQSPKKLIVREDVKKGVFVDGLWEEPVENVLMAVGLLNQGIRNRHIGETQMNR